jgi:hypothetical protein
MLPPGARLSAAHGRDVGCLVERRVLRAVLETGEVLARLIREARLLRHHPSTRAELATGESGDGEDRVGAGPWSHNHRSCCAAGISNPFNPTIGSNSPKSAGTAAGAIVDQSR